MAISLVMVYALVRFMTFVGDSVGDGRAMIELSGQLRGVRQRLHDDLSSLTVEVRPWADDGAGAGYFEIFEGIRSDVDRDGDFTLDVPTTNTSLFGDFDDYLGMTIQAKGEPFVGKLNGSMINSQVAEVIWYTAWDDKNNDGVPNDGESRYLYRRQLLVLPGMTPVTLADVNAVQQWQRDNDMSVNITPSMGQYVLRSNSLADLSRRENRFGRIIGSSFPFALDGRFPARLSDGVVATQDPPMNSIPANPHLFIGNRLGEDVQLSRCLAFDVRVFDPTAPILKGSNSDSAGPSDVFDITGATVVGKGAYVDLRYNRYYTGPYVTGLTPLFFAGAPETRSGLNNFAVYDTWSMTYERDGINQADNITIPSGGSNIDEGTNGIDDDNNNGVDDVGERETSPPYPVPLRGIQVMIRAYDPDTRQMRQATVIADFVPE